MSCSDNEILIFADGVPLPRPQKITGCKGDTVRFTASTTLAPPVSYTWSLDNTQNVVWAGPSFSYTFDDTSHGIILTATGSNCGIGTEIRAKGQTCTTCPAICKTQTVLIPAGELISLTDETGKIYPIVGCTTICKDDANRDAAGIIKRALKDRTKCKLDDIRVAVYNNRNGRACISLTIANSPIRLTYATVANNAKYTFDRTHC